MDSVTRALNEVLSSSIDAVREIGDVISSSAVLQTSTSRADSLLAKWRWHDRALGPSIRVPISTEWDHKLLFALAELVHAVLSYGRDAYESNEMSLPPTTLALIVAQLLVFSAPDGVALKQVCLSPFCVVEKREWQRLVTCAFVHMDATHLVSNLANAVPDCLYLERTEGSAGLAADVLGLTLLSHGLYVGYTLLERSLLNDKQSYYSVGAVGFSSVTFALKVLTGQRRTGQQLMILPGVLLPAQFSWVYSLTMTTLLVPQASFPAHICGVVAGIVRGYLLGPVFQHLRRLDGGDGYSSSQGAGRPRFYGSSTLSGRPVRRSWPRVRWMALLRQMGLAAAAVGVYLAAQQRIGANASISRWRFKSPGTGWMGV